MKNALYITIIVITLIISLFYFERLNKTDYEYQTSIVRTFNDYNFDINSDSTYNFYADDFTCFFPIIPIIQELNTETVDGRHFFALDSSKYLLYSINVVYRDDGFKIEDYDDNETFLTTYIDQYLKNAKFMIDPKLIHLSKKQFKSKYDGMEFKAITNVKDTPLYQQGVFFIKGEHLFKLAINYPLKSKQIAENKYSQFISSFNFISD